MIALAIHRAEHCPGCGGRLSETTDIENEGKYRTETIRCHRCTALARSAASLLKGEVPADHPHAVLHTAQLKT